MVEAPLVRARHMKSILESVARLPLADAARIRAAMSPGMLRGVEEATSIDWLPMDINVAATRAVRDVLGEAGFHRFFRDTLRDAFAGPLLRVVVEAAMRVFRVDAAAFASWIGRGWGLVFRNCGSWVVERAGAGDASLRIEGLPDVCLVDDVWPRSVAHSLDAFWTFSRTSGACTLVGTDRARRTAVYRLTWK